MRSINKYLFILLLSFSGLERAAAETDFIIPPDLLAIKKPHVVNPNNNNDVLIRLITDHWQEWCTDYQKEMNDGEVPSPMGLETYPGDKNLFEIQLTPDGKMGTVLNASFSCNGTHTCGSGGCVNYILADGRIFQRHGHMPYSITQGRETLIVLPKSGGSCELSDQSMVYGADLCLGVATWDEFHSAFRSIGNQLPLSDISPD